VRLRAPPDTIVAPLFPMRLPWVNAPGPQSTLQRGRPMLVEFWDFCRPNSLRTLPYLKAWHERYGSAGLRTIGVHCPSFDPSRRERAVREAVARLGIPYPVLIDSAFEICIGRGNHAHVTLDNFIAANSRELAVLKHAQQSHLRG